MGIWGLENLNPIIFMQSTSVSIELRKKKNFSKKIAQDYVSTHTNSGPHFKTFWKSPDLIVGCFYFL